MVNMEWFLHICLKLYVIYIEKDAETSQKEHEKSISNWFNFIAFATDWNSAELENSISHQNSHLQHPLAWRIRQRIELVKHAEEEQNEQEEGEVVVEVENCLQVHAASLKEG